MSGRSVAIAMAVAALVSIVAEDTWAGTVQYTVKNLGNIPTAWPGIEPSPVALNNSGWVVGYAETISGSFDAFLYHDGVMHDLGTLLNGTLSEATGINDMGDVTGYVNPTNGGSDVFLYSNGVMSDLGSVPGWSWTQAAGINNSRQIVGTGCASNGYEHSFLYSGGTKQDLGTLGGIGSEANGINNNGQITGYIGTGPSNLGYVYSHGTLTTFSLPGYQSTSGNAINIKGQVVGDAIRNLAQIPTHAILYSDGILKDLGTLGGDYSRGCGINANGLAVGYSTFTNDGGWGHWHAFLYKDGTMRDLNDLIGPSAGTLTTAMAINDVGQITGYGVLPSGDSYAYLLTPLPEPSVLSLLMAGGLILFVAAWQRQRTT